MTAARARLPSFVVVALAAVVGVIVALLVLWLVAPELPARLESSAGFHWVGEEPGTGRAVLLREQVDGHQIVAGSDRFGIPGGEPVRCHRGAVDQLRDAAKARGRIENLTLRVGSFHRLRISADDLGGAETSYLYRCGDHGAQPLLSWGSLPGFGARSLAIVWLVWMVAVVIALALVRRRR